MADKSSGLNSFGALSVLPLTEGSVAYYRLSALAGQAGVDLSRLPFTIKILLESALRCENGVEVKSGDVLKLARYDARSPAEAEVPFMPVRVLMQDFTGVPALADLAALRDALARLGRDPQAINPRLPVDVVIDHSVQVDSYGTAEALGVNARMEFERNRERYEFLHWGQKSFSNFRVVPPASGICHQVNLEYLAKVVWLIKQNGTEIACPDTLVGTDSHTTMINGLGVLGWGVGGIEAAAAMLGQPVFLNLPEVIGVCFSGVLPAGCTATDLVLAVTQKLRKKGVVGKFVEFFGPGLSSLTLPDRATVANMAPEYGATCGFFPVDEETLRYMRATGRSEAEVELAGRYCKEQGLFRNDATPAPVFADTVEIDLAEVNPSLAGPSRPQDRISLKEAKSEWRRILVSPASGQGLGVPEAGVSQTERIVYPDGSEGDIGHGAVAIAAITSCTNTSNPMVMIGAGVMARKAVAAGLKVKPYVKTSFAPGSMAVSRYLDAAGLTPYLEKLGFNTVGYGCTTCIGNSGPLPAHVSGAASRLALAAVLSGNRNFGGRINPLCRGAFLASPPLVLAYALAGTMDFDFEKEPLGSGPAGKEVFLRDIWPTESEIRAHLALAEDPGVFREAYSTLYTGNKTWNMIGSPDSPVYRWDPESNYLLEPPFFKGMTEKPAPIGGIRKARVLALLGGSVSTDHISPAGAIAAESPAGRHLTSRGVAGEDFNSYGSRRGNDQVMVRGTFANKRLRNLLVPGTEGGVTLHQPSGEQMSVFDAAERYRLENTPVIVLAGPEYGIGSSRDWAAKGVFLLGVRAVIAESYERIHRSNLVGMGVLPLQFMPGEGAGPLGLTGLETYTILPDDKLAPRGILNVAVDAEGRDTRCFDALCRIDTPIELEYFRHGGILQYVLRGLIGKG
ncbi:MAG: aconitate hydratase AcnA [Elusimicrobia bacterium CG_4_10_14_0_2_um_filter_56_8]|nr:MAG: aconitate hydratase 1 [Elusimicrobia bacterium CG1_02_56_21]PJA13446.1 MAG: aconitate hydratase AcnA [Elusimicrobia bacterium CG_4_10_14_0_2_um_filter_56_8]